MREATVDVVGDGVLVTDAKTDDADAGVDAALDTLPLVYSRDHCAMMLTESIRARDEGAARRVLGARIVTDMALHRALFRASRRGIARLVKPLVEAGADASVQVRHGAASCWCGVAGVLLLDPDMP